MKEVIKNLLKQNHLVEPELIKIISNEALSSIPFTELIIKLNPPKLISKKFLLTNIFKIINEMNELNLDKEILIKANNYLLTFIDQKAELKIQEKQDVQEKEPESLTKEAKRNIIVTDIIEPEIKKITVKDFVMNYRDRFLFLKNFIQEQDLKNLTSIGKISNNRRIVSIIGLVFKKRMTKNKNLLLEIEDLTGKVTVLINHNRTELFEKAKNIVLDEVIGIKGSGSNEIIFANEVSFSDIAAREKKKSNKDKSPTY